RTPNPANLTHPTVTLIQPATASTRHRELTITLNLTPIPGSHRTRPATILRHLPARRPPSKYHAALHALIRPRLSTLALPGRRHGRVRLSAGHALRNSIRVPTLDHGSAAARARGPPGRAHSPALAAAAASALRQAMHFGTASGFRPLIMGRPQRVQEVRREGETYPPSPGRASKLTIPPTITCTTDKRHTKAVYPPVAIFVCIS